jgi:hypothetical protein
MCSNCFTCFDRCPQDVKPIEVIIALKNLMAKEGIVPKGVDRLVDGLLSTGRSALVTSATHRRREELGLPELGEVNLDELQTLLADSDSGSPADSSAEKPEVARSRGGKNKQAAASTKAGKSREASKRGKAGRSSGKEQS